MYTKDFIEGLPDEVVNASLECANPVVLANPKLGETVLDLGSGGGINLCESKEKALSGAYRVLKK